jgi:predicted methyltransferase
LRDSLYASYAAHHIKTMIPMKKIATACAGLLFLAACNASPVTPPAAAGAQADTDQPGQVVPPTSASELTGGQIDTILAGAWRSPANRARDIYRHPRQTLQFFGIRPDMKVIEITPGGGWYSEVLAPLLRDNGQYIAAVNGPAAGATEESKAALSLKKKFAGDASVYGKARFVEFDPKAPKFGPAGSVDMVLTFRNVHNWVMDDTQAKMFKAFFDVLQPGGVLGVVDHRADDAADLAHTKETGYLPTPYVIKLATEAGFQLVGKSEINANPKDTKDYAKGVWTLPPTLELGDTDKAKYLAIGESDRMTLRFVKPATPAAPTH